MGTDVARQHSSPGRPRRSELGSRSWALALPCSLGVLFRWLATVEFPWNHHFVRYRGFDIGIQESISRIRSLKHSIFLEIGTTPAGRDCSGPSVARPMRPAFAHRQKILESLLLVITTREWRILSAPARTPAPNCRRRRGRSRRIFRRSDGAFRRFGCHDWAAPVRRCRELKRPLP
jgi:hypothetical protein